MTALGRGLVFLALVALIGAASVRLILQGRDVDEHRLLRFLVAASFLGVAGMGILGAGQLLAFRDPFAPLLEDVALLLSTQWGRTFSLALAGFLVLPILLLWRGPAPFILLLPAALALYPPLSGHAAATEAWTPWTVAADWVHVVAAGCWLGALGALLYLGRRGAPHPLLDTLGRFSVQARWSVTLLVISGSFASWVHLPAPEALLREPWGRILAVKLVLVAGMMALGARNWRTLTPSVGTPEGDAALVRASWGEALLGILVLAATAVLTGTAPP